MSLSSDFHSLLSVQEWLKRMRDECASVAFAHAKATAGGWTGVASTRFDEYRYRARKRWLDVSDAFEIAHDAVETYLYTHIEVSRLVEYADPEQADRLWRQLAEEEHLAVRAVGNATDELRHVRSELRDPDRTPERDSRNGVLTRRAEVEPAPAPVPSRAEDFLAKPHVETVVTTLAITARYPRWRRWSTEQGSAAL
ncbi:putative T7SS-secreted protein [Lentzea sp. NPDC059081]|uniref:putative T7SS-secreted protein n=1 Tax=Lentzea sp. NPDC059081 TaxID=3346719 RepID=UPI0036BCA8D3